MKTDGRSKASNLVPGLFTSSIYQVVTQYGGGCKTPQWIPKTVDSTEPLYIPVFPIRVYL